MTVRNPYKIDGPAMISFSGGRTSGYMLRQILDAHGGGLPADVVVTFQNTGREMPQTLDFVQRCSEEWSVPIVWLEYRRTDGKHSFEVVNHNSASRNGEPFEAIINERNQLPNPITRYCTQELKMRPAKRYAMQVLGWTEWDNVVGIRADEPRRVARMRKPNRERWENLIPLADAGVTVADVGAFWRKQPFDLALPNIGGKTPMGNCDICFLKGLATVARIIREFPDRAEWWAQQEETFRTYKTTGEPVMPQMRRFRVDRPTYRELIETAQNQGDMFDEYDDNGQPCMCHD